MDQHPEILPYIPEAFADGRQESVHALQGLLGAVLLHEADADDDDDGEGDGGGVVKLRRNSMEKFWLEFWLKKWLEFRL